MISKRSNHFWEGASKFSARLQLCLLTPFDEMLEEGYNLLAGSSSSGSFSLVSICSRPMMIRRLEMAT